MNLFSEDRASSPSKPLIVLLQGPVGPFFRDLQQSLIDRGFETIKINFNGGDLLFSARLHCIDFVGSPADWSNWLAALVARRRPAAIVLFGDSRPYHVEALRIAHAQQITTWCLEEGYIRPDYVSCERGGNNARSPLRLAPTEAEFVSARQDIAVGNAPGAIAKCAMLYAIGQAIMSHRYRDNVRHRQRTLATEAPRWALSFLRKAAFYRANRRVLQNVLRGRLRNYFVIALQVHDDLNLLRNGNGWSMERLIDETTRSFARYAPPTHVLLFKIHPLDRGHRPYRRLIANAARRFGCQSRVRIADDGPIGPMIRHSDGLITVNSTSGLLALRHGRPLLVLGEAVYSTTELKTSPAADLAELHTFWRLPESAPTEAAGTFLDRLRSESLLSGSFYVRALRPVTAAAVADKIHGDYVSSSLAQLLAASTGHERAIDGTEHERLAG
jgi:capsular polysaccharide export protein